MSNIFNSVFNTKVKKSRISMNYDHKLTLDMGKLVPVHLQEVVPGDIIRQKCEVMLRFAPMLAPIMHRVDAYVHFFYVPNRLLWPNWETFITGSNEPGGLEPSHPYLVLSQSGSGAVVPPGSLHDYLGIPAGSLTGDLDVSALPYAAYQFIYNEFYRDQNLIDPVDYKLTDGMQTDNNHILDLFQLRTRAWQHDYFTGALPFAQKGDAVSIPLAEFPDVPVRVNDPDGDLTGPQKFEMTDNTGSNPFNAWADPGVTDATGVIDKELFAETSEIEAGSTSIRDLRRAFKLQEWLEKNARGGTRYVESLLSHFGVTSSDRRLDRPEFLGGARTPVTISEVLQTSETGDTPQANMSGHGISVGAGRKFSYRVEEHGFIMGIMSILPKTSYFQGVPRTFNRRDRLDYYWPSFQHIGEQEVLNKELYVNSNDPDGTFGYIPRYAEYKFIPSRISGNFQDNLDFWHLGRKFENEPTLSKEFVEADPSKRIFAVTDPDVNSVYAHVYNEIDAIRPMAKYANPSF